MATRCAACIKKEKEKKTIVGSQRKTMGVFHIFVTANKCTINRKKKCGLDASCFPHRAI